MWCYTRGSSQAACVNWVRHLVLVCSQRIIHNSKARGGQLSAKLRPAQARALNMNAWGTWQIAPPLLVTGHVPQRVHAGGRMHTDRVRVVFILRFRGEVDFVSGAQIKRCRHFMVLVSTTACPSHSPGCCHCCVRYREGVPVRNCDMLCEAAKEVGFDERNSSLICGPYFVGSSFQCSGSSFRRKHLPVRVPSASRPMAISTPVWISAMAIPLPDGTAKSRPSLHVASMRVARMRICHGDKSVAGSNKSWVTTPRTHPA